MAGVNYREVLRPLGRLKWLFIILISCYAFLPGDESQDATTWQSFPFLGLVIWVNFHGMAIALLMCLQIWTVLLASSVVRLTGHGTDMVIGLRAIGLPRLFVYPLDLVLAKLSGAQRTGSGTGRKRQQTVGEQARLGFFTVLLRLIRGDVAAFTSAIRSALDDARQQVEDDAGETLDSRFAHDAGVIA
ncbi:MAG TPA: hypothetical protein PKD72_14915, partial [Gemmatales bacterium]|nr:hypothetical protein [Gemmatales bacterium]